MMTLKRRSSDPCLGDMHYAGDTDSFHSGSGARGSSKSFSFPGKTREETGLTVKNAHLEETTSKPKCGASLPITITKITPLSTSTSNFHSISGQLSLPPGTQRTIDEESLGQVLQPAPLVDFHKSDKEPLHSGLGYVASWQRQGGSCQRQGVSCQGQGQLGPWQVQGPSEKQMQGAMMLTPV